MHLPHMPHLPHSENHNSKPNNDPNHKSQPRQKSHGDSNTKSHSKPIDDLSKLKPKPKPESPQKSKPDEKTKIDHKQKPDEKTKNEQKPKHDGKPKSDQMPKPDNKPSKNDSPSGGPSGGGSDSGGSSGGGPQMPQMPEIPQIPSPQSDGGQEAGPQSQSQPPMSTPEASPSALPEPQQTPPPEQPQSQDSANGSPCQVAPNRQGIVAAAMWAANSGKYISYSQDGRRWSGITQKACPFQAVPAVTDCSAFVTWLYWSAFGNGQDFLNNQNWRAGYTGTMGSNGTPVSLAQARPGDVVLYGRAPYDHAVLYVGNNQVVSFGQNGPAKFVPINYRSDYSIRSYLP